MVLPTGSSGSEYIILPRAEMCRSSTTSHSGDTATDGSRCDWRPPRHPNVFVFALPPLLFCASFFRRGCCRCLPPTRCWRRCLPRYIRWRARHETFDSFHLERNRAPPRNLDLTGRDSIVSKSPSWSSWSTKNAELICSVCCHRRGLLKREPASTLPMSETRPRRSDLPKGAN
eukprot:Amastigsp_a843960_162.p4 type:complete len:173 gc:universal Amastigsp_a843960_162:697-179(-)